MSFLTRKGLKEMDAETINISLNGLSSGNAQISDQYVYQDGLDRGIYPIKGWLDITFTTELVPGSGQLTFYIVPGTQGSPVLGLPAVNSEVSSLFEETGLKDNAFVYYAGSWDSGDLAASTVYQRRFMIGHGGMIIPPVTLIGMAPDDYDTKEGALADLPKYWSLLVFNGLNVGLGASFAVTFTPTFDIEVWG